MLKKDNSLGLSGGHLGNLKSLKKSGIYVFPSSQTQVKK